MKTYHINKSDLLNEIERAEKYYMDSKYEHTFYQKGYIAFYFNPWIHHNNSNHPNVHSLNMKERVKCNKIYIYLFNLLDKCLIEQLKKNNENFWNDVEETANRHAIPKNYDFKIKFIEKMEDK